MSNFVGISVKACCVNGCRSQQMGNSGIQFFMFPLEAPEILNKWVLAINKKNFIPTLHHSVCSVHFKDEDFQYHPGSHRKCLKEQAVPSLLLDYTENSKTKPTISTDSLSALPAVSYFGSLVLGPEIIISTNDNVRTEQHCGSKDKAIQTNNLMHHEKHIQTTVKALPKFINVYQNKIKILNQKVKKRNTTIKKLYELLKYLKGAGLVDVSQEEISQDNFEGISLKFFNNDKVINIQEREKDVSSLTTCPPQHTPSLSSLLDTHSVFTANTQANNLYILSVKPLSSSAPPDNDLYILSVEPAPSTTPLTDNPSGLSNPNSSKPGKRITSQAITKHKPKEPQPQHKCNKNREVMDIT